MRGSGVQFPPAAPLHPIEIQEQAGQDRPTGRGAATAFSPGTEHEPTDSLAHRWHTDDAFVPRLFAPAIAQTLPASTPYPVSVPGWDLYCRRAQACPDSTLDRTWRGPVAELARINRAVNRQHGYVLDLIDEWYPVGERGAGDCEDFALEKRVRLIAAGWPIGNLRLAVMRNDVGAHHAVLLAWTAGRWWALDVDQEAPVLPAALPYTRWFIEPWQGRAWGAFDP